MQRFISVFLVFSLVLSLYVLPSSSLDFDSFNSNYDCCLEECSGIETLLCGDLPAVAELDSRSFVSSSGVSYRSLLNDYFQGYYSFNVSSYSKCFSIPFALSSGSTPFPDFKDYFWKLAGPIIYLQDIVAWMSDHTAYYDIEPNTQILCEFDLANIRYNVASDGSFSFLNGIDDHSSGHPDGLISGLGGLSGMELSYFDPIAGKYSHINADSYSVSYLSHDSAYLGTTYHVQAVFTIPSHSYSCFEVLPIFQNYFNAGCPSGAKSYCVFAVEKDPTFQAFSVDSVTTSEMRQYVNAVIDQRFDSSDICDQLSSLSVQLFAQGNSLADIVSMLYKLSYISDQLTAAGKSSDSISQTLLTILSRCNILETDVGNSDLHLSHIDDYLKSISDLFITLPTCGQCQCIIDALNSLVGSYSNLESLTSAIESLSFSLSVLSDIRSISSDTSDFADKIFDYLFFEQTDDFDIVQAYLKTVDSRLVDLYSQSVSQYNRSGDIQDKIVDLNNTFVDYLSDSVSSFSDILATLDDFSGDTRTHLKSILDQLIAQGTELSQIHALLDRLEDALSVTNASLTDIDSALGSIDDTLLDVYTSSGDINGALDDIKDKLDRVIRRQDLSLLADLLSGNSDLKDISSNLLSRLLSLLSFVSDFFGDVFTSVPSFISSFNSAAGFWSLPEYSYSPYKISVYSDQKSTYANSGVAVQALFAEAEKYLGYPYVWGGSNPQTSFDCSGYVCYCLNASGVYNCSRVGAQALYDQCDHISSDQALPGDLIFYTGTYDCDVACSHVGFYAGNGRMLHCGDPICYTDCTTAYWQSHFYAYGRLPYVTDLTILRDLPAEMSFVCPGVLRLEVDLLSDSHDFTISLYQKLDSGSVWNKVTTYEHRTSVSVGIGFTESHIGSGRSFYLLITDNVTGHSVKSSVCHVSLVGGGSGG